MLNSVNLNDKTYEEQLAEAIALIPLYSKEWTNFNVSDPGITTLQNLTAFQMLQQDAINEVPEEARRKLLKLAGYTARENHAAELLVQTPVEGGPILMEGHQLWSSNLAFETTDVITQSPWGLAAVYTQVDGEYREITRLLDTSTDTIAYPFGRQPEAGSAIVCVLSGVPEVGEKLTLWLQVAQEELRTPFQGVGHIPEFSRVRWQYYTESGWQDARMEDETIGFLRSGTVELWLEKGFPQPLTETPVQGCALRCLLDSAEYDRVPRLRYLAVHLFTMTQKETLIRTFSCHGGPKVELRGRLPQLGNLLVYCKESEDGPYYQYWELPKKGVQGRFFHREATMCGEILYFDTTFGEVPWNGPDAIRVTCLDNEMIHHRGIEPARGYDHQIIQMDLISNVLQDGFLLAVEVSQRTGDDQYWFVRPGEKGPDGFSYHIRSSAAQVVIDDPGRGGYQLFLAGCCVTQGERGNLRARTVLEQRGGYDGTEVEARYFCPAPGRGGVSYESAEEVRLRFSAGMRQTTVAVRATDYEELVKKTPGLCIHKVKAVAFGDSNLVKIAVKPHTEEPHPKLSENYLRQIRNHLEQFRVLTTRFELLQPHYVPVGVNVVMSIRGMAEFAQAETEELLRQALDHVNGEHNFGEWVRFNDLYQRLSALPFVTAVEALNLFPESRKATLVGSDICLGDDSLCYPGTIRITLRKHGR